MTVLVVDNRDSFVFNVARYCAELGREVVVLRSDAVGIHEIERLAPEAIIISPGPGTPTEAGISMEAVRTFSGRVPLLGVCLGHQCIGAAFGGRIERAKEPMHGRSSPVWHDAEGLFSGLPSPLTAGRYHSLVVVETAGLGSAVRVTARAENGEVMGLAHARDPTLGVQFHPESVLSEHGHDLFSNFFRIADDWWADAVA